MGTMKHHLLPGLLALALTMTALPTAAIAAADSLPQSLSSGVSQETGEALPLPEEEHAAAKIGSVCYATLSDALAAAVSGDTITLLEDAVLDGSGLGNAKGVLILTQDLTLDGGGHTLTAAGVSYDSGSGGGPNLVNIEEGARVVLRNLTIDGGQQAKNGLNIYRSSAVLENVTVENSRWYAVVCNGSRLEIDGLTTRGNGWGINVDNLAGSPSRFTMRSGAIGEEVSVFFQSGNAGVAEATTGLISGGTYHQVGFLPGTTGVDLTITGGTFSFDPSAYTTVDSTQVLDNGDGTWTVCPAPGDDSDNPGGSDGDGDDPDTPDDGEAGDNDGGDPSDDESDNGSGSPDDDSNSSGGSGGGSDNSGGSGGGTGGGSGDSTTTEKHPDGSTTTTVTRPDGSVTQTHQTADGVTGTTVTDASGAITEMTVSVPSSVADSAAGTGEPVTLPVKVPAVSSSDAAPAVDISLPHSAGSVRVEIPVGTVTPGTVAVLVNADGTEEVLKTSLPTDAGVALTLTGSATVKILDNSLTFPDVHEAECWAQDPIDFVTSRQLFHGTTHAAFTPDAPMTRAQLMTVLARLNGAADLTGGSHQGMAWAVEQGLTDGSNPSGAISRQQLAAVLYRYAGSPAVTRSRAFSDSHLVSDYAADAMAWAVENGIINGRADGTLHPTGHATRAQVAAMVQRYCLQMH